MNPGAVFHHAVDVGLLALTLTGCAAMPFLATGAAVPDLLLPVAAALAVSLQWWRCRRGFVVATPIEQPALLLVTALVLLTAAAILGWGSLATASRFWDGAAMWDWKTGLLTVSPGLEQPAFRDPGVLCHSRDYPLLQPLLLALLERTTGHARLLFPVLYLMQAALVLLGARRGGASTAIACLLALAFALTPMVLNPSSGGFDSGYADAFLAMAVTAIVAGIVAGDRLWLATGIVLAVLVKPEGLPYGAIALVATWLGGARALLLAAAGAWAAALTLWFPVQARLQDPGGIGAPWLAPQALGLLFAGALLASQTWLAATRRRTRGLLLAVLVVACLVALPLGLGLLGGGGGSTLAAYGGSATRALERLPRLPEIAFGLLDHAVLRGQFGVAFVLPLVAAIGLAHRRHRNPAAMHWLLAFVVLLPLPFLLSPLDDLQHHLRSTMARLLFHQLGPALLATGIAIASLCEPEGGANAQQTAPHSM